MFAAQVLFPQGSTIFHQHTPGTSGNVSIMRHYDIRPVVQMRNMLDSIVSVRELLDNCAFRREKRNKAQGVAEKNHQIFADLGSPYGRDNVEDRKALDAWTYVYVDASVHEVNAFKVTVKGRYVNGSRTIKGQHIRDFVGYICAADKKVTEAWD